MKTFNFSLFVRSPFPESTPSYDCSRYPTIFKCIKNFEFNSIGTISLHFYISLVDGGRHHPFGIFYIWKTKKKRHESEIFFEHVVGKFGRSTGVQQFTEAVVLDMRLFPHRHHVNGWLRRRFLCHHSGPHISGLLSTRRIGKRFCLFFHLRRWEKPLIFFIHTHINIKKFNN